MRVCIYIRTYITLFVPSHMINNSSSDSQPIDIINNNKLLITHNIVFVLI